jgi:hypothetical protein
MQHYQYTSAYLPEVIELMTDFVPPTNFAEAIQEFLLHLNRMG